MIVVPSFSYYVLCNLSYDNTRWTWYCNKNENHAYRPAMTENGKINVLIKEAWKLICCYGNHIQDRIMFNFVD